MTPATNINTGVTGCSHNDKESLWRVHSKSVSRVRSFKSVDQVARLVGGVSNYVLAQRQVVQAASEIVQENA